MPDPTDSSGKLRTLLASHIRLNARPENPNLAFDILREIADLTAAGGGSVYLREPGKLRLSGCLDPDHAAAVLELPLPTESYLWQVERTRRPLLIRDSGEMKSLRGNGGGHYRSDSALLFPLIGSSGSLFGAICLHDKAVPPFTEEDLDLCTVLSLLGGLTIDSLQMAQAMSHSAERYQEVFEHSASGILLLDLTGDRRYRITAINPALELMTGYSNEEVSGRPIDEILPADVYRRLQENYRIVLETGSAVDSELWAEFPAGRKRLRSRVIPIREATGEIRRLVAFPEDITEQTVSRQALQESEEKFSKAFHSSPDSIVISRLSDGLVLDINDGFSRDIGYAPNEVVGRSSLDERTGFWVRSEERARFANLVAEKGQVRNYEALMRRKDGSVKESLLSGSSIDFRGDRCLLTISRDVTEQKRTERALRESGARYREIFENTSDGILVVEITPEMRYRLVSINPAQERMLEVRAEEVIGSYNEDFLPPELIEKVDSRNRECIELGRPVSFEEEAELSNGRFIFTTTLVPIKDETGRVARLIGVTRDITEEKLAKAREREQERRLFQASKLVSLGTLVSGIAHEINNPNNFIRLNVQNLREMWADIRLVLDRLDRDPDGLAVRGIPYREARPMVHNMIAGIEEGSKRIEKLLVNLREFARGDEGELTEEVDLNRVIDSAVMLMRETIRKSTDHFGVISNAEGAWVRGNYHQIEQVLINLITNACQSLRSRADRVEVRTELSPDGDTVSVVVIDEGVGIPDALIARIADPFFTTKQSEGGSGLGLAVSSRIVANHGGELRFSSAPGRGTGATVVFTSGSGAR